MAELNSRCAAAASDFRSPSKLPMTAWPMRRSTTRKVPSPAGEGTFRVVDLRIGQAVIGSFEGDLKSDAAAAHLELSSAMATGEISGGCTLALAQPYNLNGKVSIKNIDLDPL